MGDEHVMLIEWMVGDHPVIDWQLDDTGSVDEQIVALVADMLDLIDDLTDEVLAVRPG